MYHKLLHKKQEKGQGLVEYALILVLVAIVVIAALMVLGPKIGGIFSKVNSSLSGIGGVGGVSAAVPTPACSGGSRWGPGNVCYFSTDVGASDQANCTWYRGPGAVYGLGALGYGCYFNRAP